MIFNPQNNIQNPMQVNVDSVYVSDLDIPNCDNGGFSGSVEDYFNSLKTVNADASATNPKYIKIWFKRSIQMNAIGFGCDDLGKNYSNIVFKALGSGEAVRFTEDRSTDSTKRNSYLIQLPPLALNGFIVEFHTADEVGLSNLIIFKANDVNARLKATDDSGTVININATNSGNLRVTDAENGLAIAKGDVQNTAFIHKFGKAPDFDPDDGYVTIWDGANDGGLNQMAYQYSTSAIIDSLSSSDNSDTQDIEVQGLDADYNLVLQTITLTGQARKALTTNLIRVFRLKNVGSSDLLGTVYCYENTAITLGVPDDATKVRAVIQVGNNQTLMAVYTIPAGKTGYMRDFFASLAGANKLSVNNIRLFIRPFGQVFQLKYDRSLIATGSSDFDVRYTEPEVIEEKSDIELRANTDETATGVSGGYDIVLIDN